MARTFLLLILVLDRLLPEGRGRRPVS